MSEGDQMSKSGSIYLIFSQSVAVAALSHIVAAIKEGISFQECTLYFFLGPAFPARAIV